MSRSYSFSSFFHERSSRPERPLRPKRLPLLIMVGFGALYLYVAWQNRNRPVMAQDAFPMMGTIMEIKVFAPGRDHPDQLLRAARETLKFQESLFSAYQESSFVSRLNRQPAGTPLTVEQSERDVLECLELARRVSEVTDGAFDISFASAGRFWRFDPENPRLPTEAERKEAIEKIDYRRVKVNPEVQTVALEGEGTRIGLGGIAKGFAVDKAIETLRAGGASGGLINAGGDIFLFGSKPKGKPWRVALQHPRNKKDRFPENGFDLKGDVAVVTSGDYERMFELDGKRYHHILNPKTGLPAEGLISVTVFSDSAGFADGLATGLFVMGPDKGLELVEQLDKVEALFILPDLSIRTSSGLPEKLAQVELHPKAERPSAPTP